MLTCRWRIWDQRCSRFWKSGNALRERWAMRLCTPPGCTVLCNTLRYTRSARHKDTWTFLRFGREKMWTITDASCTATMVVVVTQKMFCFCAQLLQEEARKGEDLWASADESCKGLARIVHRGTAQRLEEHVKNERKRSDMLSWRKNCVANHGDNHCWMLHLVYIICDVKHLFIFSDSIQLRFMLRELLLKSFTWGFHSIHPPL